MSNQTVSKISITKFGWGHWSVRFSKPTKKLDGAANITNTPV